MAIHSGNITVQRREERLLIQARLVALDIKLDQVLAQARGAAKEPSPPQSPEVTTLAKAMADPDYHLPTGSTVHLDWDDDEELIATGLTIEGRFWSVSDIVKLGLINDRGAWLWSRYSAISHALPPVNNDYLRPHYAATVAGRPSL
jgi:hypothetical protein